MASSNKMKTKIARIRERCWGKGEVKEGMSVGVDKADFIKWRPQLKVLARRQRGWTGHWTDSDGESQNMHRVCTGGMTHAVNPRIILFTSHVDENELSRLQGSWNGKAWRGL